MAHWKIFTAAPHRMMFFGGSLQLVLTLTYWTLELVARHTGAFALPAPGFPSSWAHAYLMLFGLFPYFLFGFLMTTYPRWMSGPLVTESRYVGAFLLMATGSVGFYAGLFVGPALLGLAVLVQAAGWSLGLSELYRVFRAAPGADKTHERFLNFYLALGALGMIGFGLGALFEQPAWMQAAVTAGLWGFVLPALVTVAHRMLPFFSSVVIENYRVVQPRWMLSALPVLLAGHVACDYLQLQPWRFAFDLPLAAIALYLTISWGLLRSFQVRLLAILHMAFLWFGIGMTLHAADSLMLLAGDTAGLGRAPLHALGIGLIAGMTLAMASRVSLGHSGRPLVADNLVWLCCWLLHLSALLRILGELPFSSAVAGWPTSLWAALIWLIAVTPWVVRFAPIFLRPRIDGRPG